MFKNNTKIIYWKRKNKERITWKGSGIVLLRSGSGTRILAKARIADMKTQNAVIT